MPRERDCKWYVESRNQLTNEVVFDWIQKHGIVESDAQMSIKCNDGRTRSLWSCEYALITELGASGIRGLSYVVWVAEGASKPRQWKFPAKKKLRLKKAKPAA